MDIEEMRKKSKAIDTIIDMLAETGDKRMICVQQKNRLKKKTDKILIDFNIGDAQLEDFAKLLEQFERLIDMWLKENNISLEDK